MTRTKMLFAALCGLLLLLSSCTGGEEATSGSAVPGAPAPETAAVDGCAIVTQADATALFGQPASPDSGHGAVTMITQCLWTWDTDTSNQLLQFHIWDPLGYDMPEDAEALDIGEGGYIRAHPVGGVDVAWLQGGQLISLAYSTIGPDAPRATERAEQVVALARQVSERL